MSRWGRLPAQVKAFTIHCHFPLVPPPIASASVKRSASHELIAGDLDLAARFAPSRSRTFSDANRSKWTSTRSRATSRARPCSSRAPAARSAPSFAARFRGSARRASCSSITPSPRCSRSSESSWTSEASLLALPVLADVKNRVKMRQVFEAYRPVVFHAAAYKHVPLIERNPAVEAVRNNTLATRTIAEIAVEFGADRFVLISTDKAVNPKTVMGQSKALCEWIVEAFGHRDDVSTRFVAVRFGNVLVPRHRDPDLPAPDRHGRAADPHPSRDDALLHDDSGSVQLVVQAGAMGRGRVFVLDMGEPVRILELARRSIRLSGREPDRDIAIEVVGARRARRCTRSSGRWTTTSRRAGTRRSWSSTVRRSIRPGSCAADGAGAARRGRRDARARRPSRRDRTGAAPPRGRRGGRRDDRDTHLRARLTLATRPGSAGGRAGRCHAGT